MKKFYSDKTFRIFSLGILEILEDKYKPKIKGQK